nr:MAG: hypothetical protein J07AB56_09440 [Candidatus Nanosalinarum sp. J07AB56]
MLPLPSNISFGVGDVWNVRQVLEGAATGLVFMGVAYGVVRSMGYGQSSFTVVSYLFIVEGVAMVGLRSLGDSVGGLRGLLENVVVVMDEEERKVKRLATGEIYRLEGRLEKLEE